MHADKCQIAMNLGKIKKEKEECLGHITALEDEILMLRGGAFG